MANMSEFSAFKRKILNLFVRDRYLVDIVTNTSHMPLPAATLIGDYMFPYDYVDETVTDVKNFICVDFDIERVRSMTSVDYVLSVYSLCHKTMMDMGGKVRRDEMSAAADMILNNSADIGVDRVTLRGSHRFRIPNNSRYYGRVNTYMIGGFNVGCEQMG